MAALTTDLKWRKGTLTFADEARGDLAEVYVSLDVPGLVLYSVAERMTYALPITAFTEITLDDLDWQGDRPPVEATA